MEFLELAADRYSVRSFSDRPIEPEKMEKILKAGIKPVCLLPIGYPSVESKPYAPWHDTCRGIEEMVEEL